ncbi:nitroreductase family protein [Nocardioides sp. BP30]|uniref:nitroreductase family protein n=1 Tax=Nocardioides sp. BP30 TaxID=3036374 RepID=UPI002469697A|nr:nitroreductase family protein [Nocardioides sp. BP30]WGL52634.1 nitroreductase family protein [Nocardioides sp. BP30]
MSELLRAPGRGAEGLTDHLRGRWSVSVFDATHTLGEEEIAALLHAAQWAPSAGNGQPWAFVVAERGNAAHQVLVRHLSRGNSGWVPRASVVFLALAQVAADEEGNGPKWPTYSYYDVGQAAAHLSVQAASMGLWVHQFAGFDQEAVARELGVPAHFQLLTGIAVGARGSHQDVSEDDAARERRDRVRKPLEQFVFGERWGEPWRVEG